MLTLNVSHKLPRRIKWYWFTKIASLLFFVSLPFLFFGTITWILSILLLVVLLGVPIFGYLMLYYRFFSFNVEQHQITVDKGIILKYSKSVAFDKVQSVSNFRSILERIFGLSTVNIWTASPGQIRINTASANTTSVSKPEISLVLEVKDGRWIQDFILSSKKRESGKNRGQ